MQNFALKCYENYKNYMDLDNNIMPKLNPIMLYREEDIRGKCPLAYVNSDEILLPVVNLYINPLLKDYNEQFQIALELAVEKHKNQTDKAGNPYILHPLHVMENVNSKEGKIVAILHDIIEDTDITENYLLKIGLSKRIVDAVVALTRSEDMDYQEYIKNLSSNSLAKEVKLSDLEHNMDLKRLPTLEEKDLERNRKYQIAYHYLINNK